MRIQEHLGKITWSIADKITFVLYGFVSIVQMNKMDLGEYGLLGLLLSIHTWIFVFSDAFSLQYIVQFGINPKNTKKANLFSLLMHLGVCIVIPGIIFLLQNPFASIFNEPRLTDIASILPIFALVAVPRTFCTKFVYRDFKMSKLFIINISLFLPLTVFTFYYIFVNGTLKIENMMYMYVVSNAISSVIAILLTYKELKFGFKGEVRIKELFKFGIPLTLTNSINSLPKQLDVYAIKYFFGSPEIVGIYYSAKNLFRVFEETLSAGTGLIYPAMVRQLENKNIPALKDTLTKGVSFMLVAFLAIIIPMQLGLSSFLIKTFLTQKYIAAIGQFNLLSLAALFLPFYLYSSLLIAEKKTVLLLKYVIFSIIVFIGAFYVVGKIGNPSLIPMAYIFYTCALGMTSTYYYSKTYGYKFSEVFRFVTDLNNFVKDKVGKKR